jgi:hypothetical protein
MADDADDDIGRSGFEPRQGPTLSDVATAAAAALAAIAGGLAIRAQEILALADDEGDIEIPGRSTCVESFKYNRHSGDLLLTLTDGSAWPYHQVPMFRFLAFVNARSQGNYFNLEVRGRWP